MEQLSTGEMSVSLGEETRATLFFIEVWHHQGKFLGFAVQADVRFLTKPGVGDVSEMGAKQRLLPAVHVVANSAGEIRTLLRQQLGKMEVSDLLRCATSDAETISG